MNNVVAAVKTRLLGGKKKKKKLLSFQRTDIKITKTSLKLHLQGFHRTLFQRHESHPTGLLLLSGCICAFSCDTSRCENILTPHRNGLIYTAQVKLIFYPSPLQQMVETSVFH